MDSLNRFLNRKPARLLRRSKGSSSNGHGGAPVARCFQKHGRHTFSHGPRKPFFLFVCLFARTSVRRLRFLALTAYGSYSLRRISARSLRSADCLYTLQFSAARRHINGGDEDGDVASGTLVKSPPRQDFSVCLLTNSNAASVGMIDSFLTHLLLDR